MENEKTKEAMNFYLLATKLKYKLRSGWDNNHWNIDIDRRESIAEHIYGTCILAIAIESEYNYDIDLSKVLKMLIIHELGEVKIGDITPFDNITPEEKEKIEHKAVISVIGDLIKKDELISLMFEFDEHKTKEAIFAYYCDKLEADIQAKVYEDMGCQHPLDDQENNVVFNNPKIQQMIAAGAETAFDIWYEWDKAKFKDDNNFTKILKHVKDNNTNI